MLSRSRLVLLLIFLVVMSLSAAAFSYPPVWNKVSDWRPWSLGLDLAGGSFLTYEIDLSEVGASDQESVVNGLRDVIERRVNLFGVSEPRVYLEQAAGTSRLVVELAGIRDVSEAIAEIGTTPFLDFREVEPIEEEGVPVGEQVANFIPTELTGRYVKGAQVTLDHITGQPQVNIEFDSEGADIFEEITGRIVGKPLAIFLDNVLIEVPVVQQKITGGRAQITGQFTIEEARMLVQRFNAGALPAPITLINQQTVSADYGQDSLAKAVLAGIFGTLAVIIFMMVYYRSFGLFAGIALLMYIALTLSIFKLVSITLTLAGIAGVILSIGMAVDANVLVFERTKEELKRGSSRSAAIEIGFRRAWTSIRDSNVSTLITTAVLYYFTSSFVQGFALALFVGVVVSMFSAITITRTLLRVFMSRG